MEKDKDKQKDLLAVALRYNQAKEKSPRVVAVGRNYLAQRILEVAQKENIPIKKDASMSELLSKLDLGEEIPPELYQIVAELFAFIYRLEANYGEHKIEMLQKGNFSKDYKTKK
ncbi:FhlB domain-containing protein [Heliorestis acidaminivorans]|uniref:FhlB domain-containing protein n=1 Tax=Heliorestis acidaminivorans TaxID=553427 RepID=A0A6I0F346_9FIRM|nr:EscU/YscU/HrcU family type III secretion system export apparatus switch protein [Heliorestis acidaminivorans]KAB2954421.1 FhlB domain-containing protein [Heliorestis acidaminivorans]